MSKEKLFKVVVVVAFIGVVMYFWPQYQKQIPKTPKESAHIALSQVEQIPPAAPLNLITEPNDGMSLVKNTIDGAQKSVDLVMYELEDPGIEQALVAAKNRGAAVRVMLQNLDIDNQEPNQPAYDFLQSQNVLVQWAPDYFALTHQKTLITDGASALIMTFNLTPRYYASSRDFAIVDTDQKDVGAIEAAFESDWQGAQTVADNGDDLVWSPGAADTLLALVNSARTSLDIYNEEMADPRIISALKQAAQRGVAVRVDMTYNSDWKAAFDELSGAGVKVRTYASTNTFYIHAKVIIADNARAFVGSQNFSLESLDLNRELGILISKPDILASLETTFNADWAGSRPFESSSPDNNSQ